MGKIITLDWESPVADMYFDTTTGEITVEVDIDGNAIPEELYLYYAAVHDTLQGRMLDMTNNHEPSNERDIEIQNINGTCRYLRAIMQEINLKIREKYNIPLPEGSKVVQMKKI